MKRRLHILLLLLLQVSFLMAQGFTVRECYEEEIPSPKRADYYKEAHRIIETHYILLLESVGESENREVIIEQMMSDRNTNTLKTDFLLNSDKASSFCTPQQYFTKFEFVYKDLVDKVEFVVDNFKDGKIMMNSLVSCYIPIEYDLTLMQGDKTLFKRRCRMYCLFPKANASKLVKVMQVEPVKDIISCKSVADSKSEKMASGTPDEWNKIGGKFYENKEYKKAVVWWQKAANQGYAKSQYNLGNCYSEGLGVPQSYVNAVKWYTKAAEQGHAMAQYNLGYCYIKGLGVPQSYVNAVKWYTKAAEQGDADAQFELGMRYEYGRGISKSYEKAVEWYTKAAEQGHADAQFKLGMRYEYGRGISKSYEKAVEWYNKAAEQEHADAQNNLGYCYIKGLGVPQSDENAVKWFTKAAEKGLASAQYNLGRCYENGDGISKSYEKAVKWYNKAAEQGHAMAQFGLGECYYNGWGVSKSYEKALEWYNKAEKQRHILAQYKLGVCYEKGQGVPQSDEKAVEWYTKSLKNGNYYVKEDLDRLKKKQQQGK